MKAIRQGYAVDMILLSYILIEKRKYILSLIPVILAYGFHNSSIIAVPFFMILWIIMIVNKKQDAEGGLFRNKSKNLKIPAIALLSLLAFYIVKYVVFASYINPILASMEMFSYSGYLDDIEGERGIAWWIILYHAVTVFFVTLYFINEDNIFCKYLAFLVIFSLFLSIGTFGFGNLMRTTSFFIIFSIVVLPNVASMLRVLYGKVLALWFVIFTMTYQMVMTVRPMVSIDNDGGTGFGLYTFSFLNW